MGDRLRRSRVAWMACSPEILTELIEAAKTRRDHRPEAGARGACPRSLRSDIFVPDPKWTRRAR